MLGYIKANPAAVLSTVNADNTPQSAVVYIYGDDAQPKLYLLTKTGTAKYENLHARPAVCLTVFNAAELSTLQASGQAAVVDDLGTIQHVMDAIGQTHAKGAPGPPPVSQIQAGAYAVIAIELTSARLNNFKK